MKHTWTEDGYEYFVTDEEQTEPSVAGWEYCTSKNTWTPRTNVEKPLISGHIYRRRLETPEQKLIREQREAGYCCFKATKNTPFPKGKGWWWIARGMRKSWFTAFENIGFKKGTIYRKKRDDIKADYETFQQKRKEAKERVSDEFIENAISTFDGRGWITLDVGEHLKALKELKQRREADKTAQ